jgi:hypothetical protein
MITPIPIPYTPPKCPNCHHTESKKTVCRHCGYEYTDPPLTWHQIAFLIVFIPVALVVSATAFAAFLRYVLFPIFEVIFKP